MNTPAQCGAIKPPKTDIYSEAPQPGDQVRDRITVLDLTERAEDRYILRAKHVLENRAGGTVMTATTRSYYILLDPSVEANA